MVRSSSPVSLSVICWGLTAACCLLSAWGWLNEGVTVLTLFFATVFALFQLATNKLGEFARALGWRRPATTSGCILLMVVFGLFCHESLKLAWRDAEALGLVETSWLTAALLFVLPFAEPFMFWLKRLLAEAESEPATPSAEWSPRVVEGGRTGERSGHLAGAAMAGLAGLAGASAIDPTGVAAPAIAQPVGDVWASREDHARALLAAGNSVRGAAKATGLTRHRVAQLRAQAA